MSPTPSNRNELNDADISELFAAGDLTSDSFSTHQNEPSADIDSQILAYAKNAQSESIEYGRETFAKRYAPLFGTAAMVAFAITLTPLVMNSTESSFEQYGAVPQQSADNANLWVKAEESENPATTDKAGTSNNDVESFTVAIAPQALPQATDAPQLDTDSAPAPQAKARQKATLPAAEELVQEAERKAAPTLEQPKIAQINSVETELQSSATEDLATTVVEIESVSEERITHIATESMTPQTSEIALNAVSKHDVQKNVIKQNSQEIAGVSSSLADQRSNVFLFRQTPKQWIVEINRLFKDKEITKAKQELNLFREKHPENDNEKLLPRVLRGTKDGSN